MSDLARRVEGLRALDGQTSPVLLGMATDARGDASIAPAGRVPAPSLDRQLAVRTLLAGQLYPHLPPERLGPLLPRLLADLAPHLRPAPPTPHWPPLSRRLLQVLAGMARGDTNADMAAALGLSESTIKTHARRLFAALGARDRAHAVALGHRAGLLGGDR